MKWKCVAMATQVERKEQTTLNTSSFTHTVSCYLYSVAIRRRALHHAVSDSIASWPSWCCWWPSPSLHCCPSRRRPNWTPQVRLFKQFWVEISRIQCALLYLLAPLCPDVGLNLFGDLRYHAGCRLPAGDAPSVPQVTSFTERGHALKSVFIFFFLLWLNSIRTRWSPRGRANRASG